MEKINQLSGYLDFASEVTGDDVRALPLVLPSLIDRGQVVSIQRLDLERDPLPTHAAAVSPAVYRGEPLPTDCRDPRAKGDPDA